jgi:UDP-glucose 4-epimerase
MFKGKTFLITGGTGSFGHTLVDKLLTTDIQKIMVFSRDEAKQHFMRQSIPDSRLTFVLGDVRDPESIQRATTDVNYIFHAAALKQVPASEDFPWEFIQTNIHGSHNLLRALENSNVEKVVFLSTDKAVYPVNAMGMSKAMMEKLVRSSNYKLNAVPTITRYGNVIGSRGSVIPHFIESIRTSGKVTVTDPNMTRFMMSLEESVSLVLFALENGNSGDLFVQKSPAATIETVVKALRIIMKSPEIELQVVGIRPGEKIHETLLTAEEKHFSHETEKYFQVTNIVQQNLDSYGARTAQGSEYTSEGTHILSAEELADLLVRIPSISKMIN